MNSMTGFGRSAIDTDGRKVTVELKSVNHRYLDVNMRLHRSISFAEEPIRSILKKRLSRGHIDVYLYYQNSRDDMKVVKTDEGLVTAYSNAIKSIQNQIHSTESISAYEIARLPDVMSVEEQDDDEDAVIQLIVTAVEQAVDRLITLRETEGLQLMNDIKEKLDKLQSCLDIVEERAPIVVEEYRTRLTARIDELMRNAAVNIDQSRLSTEVALFADKSSIDEEISRLKSHILLMHETVGKNEPIGRPLDFIVQEMNREVNTICSKANDINITNAALEMKGIVEKIREQVQNVE